MKNTLQRLIVARHTGQLPPDLADELLELLTAALPAAERRAHQQRCIRAAAQLLNGTAWGRAEQLATLIARWTGHPSDRIRQLLYAATQTGLKLPRTARGIYSIISEK